MIQLWKLFHISDHTPDVWFITYYLFHPLFLCFLLTGNNFNLCVSIQLGIKNWRPWALSVKLAMFSGYLPTCPLIRCQSICDIFQIAPHAQSVVSHRAAAITFRDPGVFSSRPFASTALGCLYPSVLHISLWLLWVRPEKRVEFCKKDFHLLHPGCAFFPLNTTLECVQNARAVK